MRLRVYVKLQGCNTNDRLAFVGRHRDAHGIAKGLVSIYAVEAESWPGIRRVLKNFDVMGHSACDKSSAQAFVKDIGAAAGRMWRLNPYEVPLPAVGGLDLPEAPELSSFGPNARVVSHVQG
jgi:hypothetical protein